jgi:hypothetical protein
MELLIGAVSPSTGIDHGLFKLAAAESIVASRRVDVTTSQPRALPAAPPHLAFAAWRRIASICSAVFTLA